jgi:hypothetical protein
MSTTSTTIARSHPRVAALIGTIALGITLLGAHSLVSASHGGQTAVPTKTVATTTTVWTIEGESTHMGHKQEIGR